MFSYLVGVLQTLAGERDENHLNSAPETLSGVRPAWIGSSGYH
jgi:hypothetical protein